MRDPQQRAVAVTLVAVLNAASFDAIGCAALCAIRSCPQQFTRERRDQCRHQGLPAPGNQRQNKEKSTCPDHTSYPTAVVILAAAPGVTPGLQNLSPRTAPNFDGASSSVPVAPLGGSSAHSPSEFSTGRTICQKQALLRI